MVRVVDLAGVTHVYFGEDLVRWLVLDPDTRFQRSTGRPRLARRCGAAATDRQRLVPRLVAFVETAADCAGTIAS